MITKSFKPVSAYNTIKRKPNVTFENNLKTKLSGSETESESESET
jgi:hypothetical protein